MELPHSKHTCRSNNHVERLQELYRLCQEGRLYEVQDWIQQGRILQLPHVAANSSRHKSALEIALDTGQHSLCQLLLRSGYQPNEGNRSPFNIAIKKRRRDLVDLLFEFGADPQRIELWMLFDSYDSELFERFLAAGVDLTRDHVMGHHLAEHTSNKPLFGFAKRYREGYPAIQTELDMALGDHAQEGNEKGVLLCLWAGADPHRAVPDLRYGRDDDPEEELGTAVEEAVFSRNLHALKVFKPDPTKIDFDRLYGRAGDKETVEFLAQIQPPRELTGILYHLSELAGSPWFIDREWDGAILAILDCGIQWVPADQKELAGIRRNLLKAKDWELKSVLKALRDPEVCVPENFHELTRTPKMQQRMLDMNLIKPYVKPPSKKELHRREVENLIIRFNREKLYAEVWQEPVIKVAETYGVSGVYLGKVCRTLRVPVPPRGYWARVRNGESVKRPKLPVLRY